MECLGGNGYVEEAGRGRDGAHLPRDAGELASGKAPATSWRSTCCARCAAPTWPPALEHELAPARGAHAALRPRSPARVLDARGRRRATRRRRARLARDVALVLQAALLHRQAPAARLRRLLRVAPGGQRADVFGLLPAGTDFEALVERALPEHRPHRRPP
ncbi:MAG: hypothetical protein MZW92_56195 [Comamonadaceae bacterium]|nr:hypothetical protein [Comamonadaceae bacterium]